MNRKHQLIYEDPDLTAFTGDELLEANHDISTVIENMQAGEDDPLDRADEHHDERADRECGRLSDPPF